METIKVEGEIGEHISTTAARAIEYAAMAAKTDGVTVVLSFNEVDIPVAATSTVSDVCAEYDRICNEQAAAYRASDEYKRRQREAEEREAARKAKLAEALATAPESMTLRDAAAWETWRKSNTDPYGAACVTYAERWARVMESMITRGATVEGCAREASHLADDEGITGFMYGAAVSMLAQCWVHGETLRRWHNRSTQIGDEGERANESGGVLNPALLSVGK